MRYLIALAFLVALAWIVWRAASRKSSPISPAEEAEAKAAIPPPSEPVPEMEHPKGPPPSGAADPLEVMRAAVGGMETDEIENLLEMGANLKPGTEELFRAELERRRKENGEG